MTALVPLALIGWVAVALLLFARLPRTHALVAVIVLGVLLLPEVHAVPRVAGAPGPLSFPGFKLTKLNAIAYAALAGSLLFDRRRWLAFRPHWIDLPVLVWCVCPVFSSLANDLGLYDGVAEALDQTLAWGVPYLLGRLYLGDPAGMRLLAVGVVLGGLLYVPLCLYEMRMSPQLHNLLYGFHQHEFQQTIRLGGYRPMAFMEHGLAVGLWMTAATLLAFWLYWTKSVPRLPLAPSGPRPSMLWAVLILVAVAVLCRSTGALALGAAGFAVLLLSRWEKAPVALAVLLAAAPLYVGLRASSAWSGEELVGWLGANYDEGRAQSLDFRLENEDCLVDKALEQPVFGWGGWGRSRIHDDEGKDVSVADGVWIIALGERGFVGLAALGLTVLLPAARFAWKYPPRRWSEPALAPAAAGAVLLALYAIDCLMNAMINPVYLLAAGGVAGLTCRTIPEAPAVRPAAVGRARPQRVAASGARAGEPAAV
jgi:hypothetical protein